MSGAQSQQLQVFNFGRMTQHLQGFTHEFQHCRNISAIESGTALLDAINGLRTQMDQLSTQISDVKREVGDVKRQVGDVTRDLDDLGRRITNSKLENNGKVDENAAIAPLVNMTTGEEIVRFPATFRDFDDLRGK
ncbi:hypothetical protein MRS44_017380 [Fusarium solani]|uniref:uncharacterized protein n=1 Tax=Fusarium solani TaxID=169388 RepID=UPI002314762B|nr:hypothetical protein MRS44_017380 [Fusarium solani]KAJ4208832.1 hypothetical protein NW759_013594 [Fusarium solani]